ncbi:MAG TPA: hypothetical protein VK181_21460 [Rhizobium sp.]|nr:hypothetical protein [Rhizobium sp.]
MSKRYWISAIAFGLICSFSLGNAQEQKQSEQGKAAQQEKPAKSYPFPFPVEIIENQSAAEARERSEAESRQREIDDLVAQQGMNIATQAMNDATQRMVGLSEIQTWLVGIGTVLLFATLMLTIQANRAAVRAAEAADRTVDVTRDIGEAQVRAYLFCVSAAYTRKKDYISAIVEIGNSGNSPASNVEVKGTAHVHCVIGTRNRPRVGSWVASGESKAWLQPIISGGKSSGEVHFLWGMDFVPNLDEGEEELKREVFNGGNEISFDLIVRWDDVFGKSHEFPMYLDAMIDSHPLSPQKKMSTAGKLSFRMEDPSHSVSRQADE